MKFKPIGKIDNLKHGLRCLEELNEEFDEKKYDIDSLVKEIDNRGEEYVKILDYVSQYPTQRNTVSQRNGMGS